MNKIFSESQCLRNQKVNFVQEILRKMNFWCMDIIYEQIKNIFKGKFTKNRPTRLFARFFRMNI